MIYKVKVVFMMDEGVCYEKSSSGVISTLPAWIIEYAWTKRMMEVLEVLGPPPWLEGDRRSLTLKDPCSIRVTAAESWMLIRARDIKRFVYVMDFLDVTHTLLPQLVTPIKHMKIMFGLRTLVIMWMLWDGHSAESITNKIAKFFPESVLQYRRCSHRHIELMQKAQRDFRNFVQLLIRNPEKRKNYITNMMEQQYGEHYVLKLEERLLHYLEELNKALPQPTHIDQVLKQSGPLNGREELLQQLFTCNSVSPTTALKKLLRCAMAHHMDHKSTAMCKQQKAAQVNGPLCVVLGPPLEEEEEEWLSQASQSSWINRDKSLEKPTTTLKKKYVLDQTDEAQCLLEAQHPEHLCSKHGKRMKSILQECSEEQRSQDDEAFLMQVECTFPPPHPPLAQSSPRRQTSASSQHDSSSTNISLSSQPESFLVDEDRQDVPLQPLASSQSFCAEENNFDWFSAQKSKIASTLKASPHPEHSVHLVTSSPTCLVQPCSSQTSSSSTNISSFPENQITPKSSSTERESSTVLSLEEMCLESSYHQPVSSPSSPAASASTFTESPNHAQVSLDSNVILESSGTLPGKPRLSLDTQAFLLTCKWLQPQVKLYRLSQHECHQPTLPTHAPELSSDEEEVDEVFDVNLLYSDSEWETHDSDDSDYVPFKTCRYR